MEVHLSLFRSPYSSSDLNSPRTSPQPENVEDERKVRVCMIGEGQVGKTSLVSQFITSEHIHTFDASLGQ